MISRLLKLANALKELNEEEFAEEAERLSQINWEEELGQKQETITDHEEEFFGSWINQLPEIHSMIRSLRPEQWLSKIRNKGFVYMGSGMYRNVFKHESAPDLVIKFISEKESSYMNKLEHNLQGRFKNLFPKVYKHGRGAFGDPFDWIIVEKVTVLETGDEVGAFFPEIYPLFKEFLGFLGVHMGFGVLLNILISEPNSVTGELFDKFLRRKTDFTTARSMGLSVESLRESAMQNPIFYDLSILIPELDIYAVDIDEGNVGVNSKGNFVILDASIFID
jgi:hypothetical protein